MNPMSLNPMNLLVTVPDLYLTCTRSVTFITSDSVHPALSPQ